MEKSEGRHNLIPYALETVARPGSRESRVRRTPVADHNPSRPQCVRRPPDGLHIRHERGEQGE